MVSNPGAHRMETSRNTSAITIETVDAITRTVRIQLRDAECKNDGMPRVTHIYYSANPDGSVLIGTIGAGSPEPIFTAPSPKLTDENWVYEFTLSTEGVVSEGYTGFSGYVVAMIDDGPLVSELIVLPVDPNL